METTVNLSGCCGWLLRTSVVYVLWLGWLVVFTERLSVYFPNLRPQWKTLIWDLVHMAWKPRSQHFISQWGQLVHNSHSGCMLVHKCSLTHTRCVHMRTHRHTLGLSNQSEWSGVGPPRSGWERCWSRSLSQDTQSSTWWFGELFCVLFLCNKNNNNNNNKLLAPLALSLTVEWLNCCESVRKSCRSPSLGKTGGEN